MDQIKTGKLIAKLRKEKGMTQQELADIFNINYRSVSKWETGKTMPDIANIDLLSEIFGVSSDELLKGELNKKGTSKAKKYNFHKKYLLFLIPLVLIIAIVAIIIYKDNESETYSLVSANKVDYYVEGEIVLNDINMFIHINKIFFYDKNFNKINIKEYRYQLILDDNLLYAYGIDNIRNGKNLEQIINIKSLTDNFYISQNYKLLPNDIINIIINKKLILTFTFTDEFNNKIIKNIEINIVRKNDNYTNSTQ